MRTTRINTIMLIVSETSKTTTSSTPSPEKLPKRLLFRCEDYSHRSIDIYSWNAFGTNASPGAAGITITAFNSPHGKRRGALAPHSSPVYNLPGTGNKYPFLKVRAIGGPPMN